MEIRYLFQAFLHLFRMNLCNFNKPMINRDIFLWFNFTFKFYRSRIILFLSDRNLPKNVNNKLSLITAQYK